MHIDSYSFGEMVVDGKVYNKDLIIFPARIKPDWWRIEGHNLAVEDLKEVFDYKPEVLVVGKGDSGLMQVPLSTQNTIKKTGIELIIDDTHEAVKIFNTETQAKKKVIGVFHLTC